MIKSDDLVNLLWYESNGDVISLPKIKGRDRIALIKGNDRKIFKHRKIPKESNGGKEKCFISMEYGVVSRENSRGNRSGINPYFKNVSLAIYIYVPETLDDILNGSRLMCIDQCLENTLSGEMTKAVTKCYVAASDPIDRPPSGYIGRRMYLRFSDVNEGAFGG